MTVSVTPSPFPYEKNCLLYLPSAPPVSMGGWREVNYLSEQILSLVEATHGHTLVLFTSYKLMGAVYRQVKDRLGFPLFEVWRNGNAAIRQFKEEENGVQYVSARKEEDQVSLTAIGEGEVLDALRRCQPDTLTPIEAMSLIYEWKQKLN